MCIRDSSETCRTEIEAIRKAKTDSQTTITQKEQAIREATEKRLTCQQKETEALAKARTCLLYTSRGSC